MKPSQKKIRCWKKIIDKSKEKNLANDLTLALREYVKFHQSHNCNKN